MAAIAGTARFRDPIDFFWKNIHTDGAVQASGRERQREEEEE